MRGIWIAMAALLILLIITTARVNQQDQVIQNYGEALCRLGAKMAGCQ